MGLDRFFDDYRFGLHSRRALLAGGWRSGLLGGVRLGLRLSDVGLFLGLASLGSRCGALFGRLLFCFVSLVFRLGLGFRTCLCRFLFLLCDPLTLLFERSAAARGGRLLHLGTDFLVTILTVLSHGFLDFRFRFPLPLQTVCQENALAFQ